MITHKNLIKLFKLHYPIVIQNDKISFYGGSLDFTKSRFVLLNRNIYDNTLFLKKLLEQKELC